MALVIDLIDHGLAREPARTCLQDREMSLTHREVESASHRIAHALRDAGLRRGSRVAFFTPNCALAVVAMIGVFRAGAVWLPVHPRNLVAENSEFLRDNDCELLFYHSRTAAEAEHFAATVPSLKASVRLDEVEGSGGLLSWAAPHPARFADAGMSDGDIAWVKGTGGTTGRSKSVLISNRSAVTLFATFHWCMPIPTGHVTLAAAPISHGAGTLALCSLCNGGTIVLIERAEPAAVLEALAAHAITTVFLPPTVIYGILALPGVQSSRLPALRYLVYSAAPMSPERLRESIDVFGPVMAQVYGQTEAPFLLTYLSPAEHVLADEAALARRLTSCGRATPFAKVGVMDDQGNLLQPGAVGEIVVRSDLVMEGYNRDPEETARVSEFGWHHTGDVGMRDEHGYFYILDRKKDMIISGGFNIYPSEIEKVLWEHPAVLECAVIGVPDEKWGEAVTAVVELKPGCAAEASALREFCRARLGGMKAPKRVEIWPELPRSRVGKVLKKDIRERFWSGQPRRV